MLSPNDAGISNLESELSIRGRVFKGKRILKFKAMTHSIGIIREVEPLSRPSIEFPRSSDDSINLPPSTPDHPTRQPPVLHGNRTQSDFGNLLTDCSPTTQYVDACKKHNCELTSR